MQDVLTLAAQRRRRRLARQQVAMICSRRAVERMAAAAAGLPEAVGQATEAMREFAATVEVQMMWERLA